MSADRKHGRINHQDVTRPCNRGEVDRHRFKAAEHEQLSHYQAEQANPAITRQRFTSVAKESKEQNSRGEKGNGDAKHGHIFGRKRSQLRNTSQSSDWLAGETISPRISILSFMLPG